MATNILNLPLASVISTTGTNEDWIESIQFVEDDGITPIDLSGIDLTMHLRHLAEDAEVFIVASTEDDGRLTIGGTSSSYIALTVPIDLMKLVPPDTYVADIVATADGYTRVIVQIALTVFQGVTRE